MAASKRLDCKMPKFEGGRYFRLPFFVLLIPQIHLFFKGEVDIGGEVDKQRTARGQ